MASVKRGDVRLQSGDAGLMLPRRTAKRLWEFTYHGSNIQLKTCQIAVGPRDFLLKHWSF
jgi:hypothetical protein